MILTGPAVHHYAEIGMTHARVCEVHQHLAGARLGGIELDDLGGNLAGRVVDDGLVFLGDLGRCHAGRWDVLVVWGILC